MQGKRDCLTDRLSSNCFVVIVLVAVFLLLFTRSITLTHNIKLHPDEHVFYQAADNMRLFLTGTVDIYTEVKEYPEGAIVLQFPFHIAAALIRRYTDMEISAQLCGRVASVFYFILGSIFGMIIEYQYFGKNTKSVCIYASALIFSIMHIEQSRYGTGDAISFFLLIIILFLSLRAETNAKRKLPCWISAGFLAGLLCSVKYPLLFWGLIPVVIVWRTEKPSRRLYIVLIFSIATIIGFLFGSPKVISDPGYVIRVVKRETTEYVLNGNVTEVGGPLNHLLSLGLYSFLYAGIPLAPIFVIATWKERSSCPVADETAYFLNKLLPSFIILFFMYNVFAKTLFMRTFYPFFFLLDLYAAEYLGKPFNGKKRALISSLMILFIVRGIYYIGVLTEKMGPKKLDYLISQTAEDSWKKTTLLTPGYFVSFNQEQLVNPQKRDLLDSRYENEEELKLKKGEMVITGSIEFARGSGYFFPVKNVVANQYCARWENFKSEVVN